jgi:hypothetical protein
VRDGTGSERGAATGDELVDAMPALEGDAWWSLGGGLVLLWPWLGELLGGDLPPAPRLPGADPAVAVRMWALAGLLDDERVPFVLDPLVRLLAGDDLSADRRLGAPTEEPAGDGTPPEQAAVLRAFAAAIPGFADSSARFLREHFLRRGALVEPLGEDAVRVRLEPLPLDPILDLLPYPPGPFRLEGIPLVVVERRRT